MGTSYGPYRSNRTTEYFASACHIIFFWGMPNFWIEDLKLPKTFVKIYRFICKWGVIILYSFVLLEWGALFTQHSLTEKQRSDAILFSMSHPLLYSYCIIMSRNRDDIKDLLYSLTVNLKSIHNNEQIEMNMIKKLKWYSAACMGTCGVSMLMYGIDAAIQTLKTGSSFVTVITLWPDVNDTRQISELFRVAMYLVWWAFMIRIFATFILVISLNICISHQYENLCEYFYNLEAIFEDYKLSPNQMEEKYEEGFKTGIKLHAETLWCTRQNQKTCSVIFVGQILVNVSVLVLLMIQMVDSERTLGNLMVSASTAAAMLGSTGFFMWNAGDVTVEASKLATAMYSSGWENCQGSCALRIRQLLVIAMMQAQKAVILRSLGVIEISYQSYLSIVKSSYSVFSVLY
ncbi:uncharacterized protein ACR2FA_009272 [Aphomia sociella]